MCRRIFWMLIGVVSIISISCTNNNVRSLIKEQERMLIAEKGWYIRDASAVICSFREKDFFADEELLLKAISYSGMLGQAGNAEAEAMNYSTSTAPEYKYNPNRFEIARMREADARRLKDEASMVANELKEMVNSASVDSVDKGIWVIHSFSYKKLVSGNVWEGPFRMTCLYRLTPDGKSMIRKREVLFGQNLFEDFRNATGKEYDIMQLTR